MPNFNYKFYRNTNDAAIAMKEAILSAQSSIYWEIYSFIDDEFGQGFVDALCEKARQGLEVKMLVDALGSFGMSRLSINRLASSGVDFIFYNSLMPKLSMFGWFNSMWHRNHRKILIVDKDKVFIGGVNVAKLYSQWDDLHVCLSGKPANILLRSFARSYIRGGGDKRKVSHLLKLRLKEDWAELKNRYHFILPSPAMFGGKSAKKIFTKSLSSVKEKFNLMTPYFVPDKNFFRLVSAAKERGAKVNLFFPLKSDHRFIDWVASFYNRLAHKSGANIFLSSKMNHGKAMTMDSQKGFISSINFTPRSFLYNEEAGILFEDQAMISELDQIFTDLEQQSLRLDEETILQSSIKSKIKAWVGAKLGKLL